MAKALIIGASRGIGLETVRAALRAGHRVRALARSAASMPIQDANLDTVSGDALDRDTIRDALQDVDVVIQTLGVNFAPKLIFEGTTLFSDSTRILVDAMQAEAAYSCDWSRRWRQSRSWRSPLRCSRLSLALEARL